MIKMGIEVPPLAKQIYDKRENLKKYQDSLKAMIEEYESIKRSIPPILLPMLKPHLNKIEARISPGLTMLNWNSLNVEDFVKDVLFHLGELYLLNKKLVDIMDKRIDSVLQEITDKNLIEVPGSEAWTLEHFEERTSSSCRLAADGMERANKRVEKAVIDVLEYFAVHYEKIKEESRPRPGANGEETPEEAHWKARMKVQDAELEEESFELVTTINNRMVDALLKCIRNSLDLLRKRLFQGSNSRRYGKQSAKQANDGGNSLLAPFFKADIILQIPNVIISPSLDDMQQALNKGYHNILEVCRNVTQWELLKNLKSDSIIPKAKNYYRYVAEHKDVTKLTVMLSSSISSLKADSTECLDYFNEYSFIWTKDKEEVVKEFLETDPILSEFRTEILKYESLEEKITKIPDSFYVGMRAILLNPERIKLALQVEAQSWKMTIGRALNYKYRDILDEVVDFTSDYTRRLNIPIKDLDDVRFAMSALGTLRENEIRIDMCLAPIEEAYGMLNKFGVQYNREESEKVDTLRYSVEKLFQQSSIVQSHLVTIQPEFQGTLLESVKNFKVDQATYTEGYDKSGPMAPGISPQEASDRLAVYQTQFDDIYSRYLTNSGGEQLFGLSVTDYPDVVRIKKELGLLQKLYGLYDAVMVGVNGYFEKLWHEVDIEAINNELIDFQNRCRRLPKALKEWDAFNELKKKIDDFNECCPLLELMANKAMKQRHWDRLEALTGHTFDINNENFCLGNIMEAPLLQNKDEIEDICISAVKEKDIEAKLAQVVSEWKAQVLTFANFKARGELLLKGSDTQEIVALLEDSLMVLSSLMSNRYNAPFKKDIQGWVNNLSNTSDIIESWVIVQNLWVYLEAVFVGGDIAKQMPKEAKRFSNIDKSWVKIMTRAHEVLNVVQCCVGDETMGQLLPHLLEQLELCQKSLTGYLEKKRLLFPRFFFVSDPALLEILGQASDSHTIQAHLLGIFDNTKNVGFHEQDYNKILSIISSEGETVPLFKPVEASGNVEAWLLCLLNEAQSSLHAVIRSAAIAINDPSFDMMNFFDTYASQVGLLGIQMIWTRDAEEALENARIEKGIMKKTNQMFLEMLNTLIDVTIRDLTKMERTKFETLVTIHVHQRDIFDDLVRMHIKSTMDFEWLKQSRFYFKEDTDSCLISITDINFYYQNEFLGCTDRLVITPLTDRCYITIAQALGMSMGAAPAGKCFQK